MDSRRQNLLLGKIRHNLKTHVNVIVGYSELLLEMSEEESKLREIAPDLERIRKFAYFILQDINKIFTLRGNLEVNIFDHIRVIADEFEHDIHDTLEFISKKAGLYLSEDFKGLNDESLEDLTKISYSAEQLNSIVRCLIEIKVDRIEDLIDSGILTKADYDLIDAFSSSLVQIPEVIESKYPSTILVVDDNASNTDYLKRKLDTARHKVRTANSIEEAEALLPEEKFDLVLLDILMPDVNGYEFLKRNAVDFQKQNTPVIMVSSLDETDTIYRCLEAGAEDYVTKPYNFITLNARINSALERKFLKDKEKEYLKTIEEEKQKSENLLLNILPKPIAERLKAHELTIADSFPSCSVLFADIVGFTPLSTKLGAKQLVDLLNEIFSAFDGFTEELGLEKIKTIGDSYMVAAGIPEPHPDHANALVEMAVRLLRYFEEMEDIEGETISIRIGIHSGPVVAGVIGKKKFIYDLWGDTVNTAARMESHGIPGAIHVSAATAELIQDTHDLEARGISEIKGKGPMETFLVTP